MVNDNGNFVTFDNSFVIPIKPRDMKGFIISYKITIEGIPRNSFHSGITPTDISRGFMNTYTEHLTSDRKEATVFFRRDEAEKVCVLFSSVHQIGKVINK